MTRGRIALFLKNKMLVSVEFNGDMYPEGWGDGVLTSLKNIEDESEFKQMIKDFNKQAFGYGGKLIYTYFNTTKGFKNYFNLADNEKYFENRFSDWIFIKNLSGKPIEFNINDDGTDAIVEVDHGETVRFNFGDIAEEDKDMFYKVT